MDLDFIQFFVDHCIENIEQIGFQPRKHGLRFRIAKPRVILDHLRSLGRQHQTEIQYALERPPLLGHRRDRRLENRFHTSGRDLLRIETGGGKRPHAAGIRSLVTVVGALMVLRGRHGFQVLPVHKRQHANLGTGQVFLDHHARARAAERMPVDRVPDRGNRFFLGHCHRHAFAQRQAVRLDHNRRTVPPDIVDRGGGILKYRIGRGGDAVFLHQFLGE